jgi:hypothetical protein
MQAWRRTEWDLAGWLDQAHRIEARRASQGRYDAAARHMGVFPAELIGIELDRPLLRALRDFFVFGSHPSMFGRPGRGFRRDAPQTAWIMALNNQLARLDHVRGSNREDGVS